MILEMGHKKKSNKSKRHRRRSSTGSNNSLTLQYTDSGDESTRLLTEDGDECDARSPKAGSSLEKQESDFADITMLNSPVLYSMTLLRVIWQAVLSCVSYVVTNWLAFTVGTLFVLAFVSVPLPEALEEVSLNCYAQSKS